MSKNLTTRAENYAQWYQDLVIKADLAENSAVRGCMVIKPYGYAIWEKMQGVLDRMFKDTGHSNAYFPLFIPKSFFSKEASHVEGFAKECAIVTHYRLKTNPDGKIVVDEEFLAIPVIKGVKTANERFAGAIDTYCIEAMMQDGKALQAGTSHFLGQNFAKAFDVKFTGKDGKQDYVWATSWGVTTRMIGA